jgi:amidohydrolase
VAEHVSFAESSSASHPAARDAVLAAVDRLAPELVELSQSIFATPELGFQEHHAHRVLTDMLERHGVSVTRHAGGLETAFVAEVGTDGPVIGVCCEYDALPEIGHACGHNIIAAAGLGAGLAAGTVAERLGGRVRIIGTPAEEGGGGKILLQRAGLFDGLAAALMVHPADRELTRMDVLAIHHVKVTYRGRAAHAAAAPEKGRNALDAAVLGYMNVAALRQHIRPDERVHGIFTRAGDKPNIVPETAEALWYVRSPTLVGLDALRARVATCLEAGAAAAGCELELEWYDPFYSDMVESATLLGVYAANAVAVGRALAEPTATTRVVGSTDMGNVSHEVPSIHPMIKVAPDGVAIHTTEFARHAASAAGDAAVLDGARIMALTVADLWAQPELVAAVDAEFRAATVPNPSVSGT